MGAELFHVDKPTNMMRLIVSFHNFVKVPNKLLRHELLLDPPEDMVAYVQHKEQK